MKIILEGLYLLGSIHTFAVQIYCMLIIDVKSDESIDRALKRYKRKFQRTRMLKELRRRKNFVKPSVARRNEVLNAEYRQKLYGPK